MGYVQKTISFDEYVWETCLSDLKTDNFSSHINKMILIGNDAIQNGIVEKSKKITVLYNEIDDLKREIKKLKFDLNKKHQSSSKFDDVVEVYGLTEQHLNMIEEAKNILDKNPQYLDGRFSLFRNETGKNLRINEFKTLLQGISQRKLNEVDE